MTVSKPGCRNNVGCLRWAKRCSNAAARERVNHDNTKAWAITALHRSEDSSYPYSLPKRFLLSVANGYWVWFLNIYPCMNGRRGC